MKNYETTRPHSAADLVLSTIIMLAICWATTACKRAGSEQQGKPVVTIRLEPVTAALAATPEARVQLGEGRYEKAGASSIQFENVIRGQYPVHVNGPYVAETVTVNVDEKGAGEATVKVAPLDMTPWAPEASADGKPITPKKEVFIDVTDSNKWQIYWRQGATVVSLTEIDGGAAKAGPVIGEQWRTHQGDEGRGATIVVDEKTGIKVVGEAADAVAHARAASSTVPLTVKRKIDVQIRQPDPHPLEQSRAPTTGGKPSIRIGAITKSGRVKQEQIEEVVKGRIPKLEPCYWGGLAKDPKLTGRVLIRFVIGRDGKTSNVGGGGDLPDKDVVECFVRVLNRAEYPTPEGGIVTVSAPFVLSP